MGVAYNPKIVTDGLILCLDAANVKSYPGSGTTWTDLSGNGNNGTLTNGPTFSSDNGGSIFFDGTDDFVTNTVTLGDILTSDEEITFCAWFNQTGNFVPKPIFSFQTNTNSFISITASDYRVFGFNAFFGLGLGTSQQTQFNVSGNPDQYKPGSWNYVVFSLKFTTGLQFVSLYNKSEGIDLKLTNSGSLNGQLPQYNQTNQPLNIGQQDNTFYFNGNISLASIYNRLLTDAEIQQNFQATRGRYGI
jgi:hypothetical protein